MTRVIEHLDLNHTPLHNVDWSALIAEVQLACHPVGSLYWRDDATDPATLFGGTWERIKDVFILAAGDTYAAGATGGEASHVLTVAEQPSVGGSIYMHNGAVATPIHWITGCFSSGASPTKYSLGTTIDGASSIGVVNFSNGGENAAHNNMPPYKVAYCWKRTA